ncbi:origin recognition complex subunit 5 C-terminus-domain-containing protein [Phakopsora pachyrhizi]|uniref:Origin recognition complex subunit 5 C-terminus-domain-containing protein n=1 Tax=Phakopsora pachyrhizi TaxID=170000 RepID=A0AAV0BGE0_PHAPC|nr:origin recognition complex subunit 5 C-terminus-domain-containing protein [Phakopsora pachyrhizi]
MKSFRGLTSIQSAHQTLSSLIRSDYPPQSIHVQSTFNIDFSLELILNLLTDRFNDHHPGSHRSLKLDERLPNHVRIDVVEFESSVGMFDRILDGLVGWNPSWNYQDRSIEVWNGRLEGFVQSGWDYQSALGKITNDTVRGLLAQRKSKSFDGFCEGLKILMDDLIKNRSHLNQPANYPRFIIINEPERLREFSDGNTILSSFTRLAEISGCPVHTIFVSRLPWSKLRPRYGALDPTMVMIPRLSHQDLSKILVSEGPPNVFLDETDGIPQNHTTGSDDNHPGLGFEEFVSFIVSSFESHTSSDLFELSTLINRLWPGWIKTMREGGFGIKDTGKMILLSRPIIELEQQSYGRPVWYLPDFLSKSGGLVTTLENSDSSSNQPEEPNLDFESVSKKDNDDVQVIRLGALNLPSLEVVSPVKKLQSSTPFTTPSKSKNYLTIFSPLSSHSNLASSQPHQLFLNLETPFKRNSKRQGGLIGVPSITSSSRSKTKDQALSVSSLPVVSRFLLISSYLASYNPVKSDLKLFFTGNEADRSKRGKSRGRKPKPGQEIIKKTRQELLGPKPFSLQRLFAIFYAILDQEGYQNFYQIDSIQQVGALIKSRLILISNQSNIINNNQSFYDFNSNKIDSIKFKCNLSLEHVLKICKSLNGFDLTSRIWEIDD